MNVKLPIYMDHHATTPLDPRVLQAMDPFFRGEFGNAASTGHALGLRAAEAVGAARGEIALLIGASPEEIIFTSGATESNNLALKGLAEVYKEKGDEIVSCVTEHKSVLVPLKKLGERGFKIKLLPVDREGVLSLADVERAITPRTLLITIMAANNEIGVIHPIREIGKIAKAKNVFFHSDAAQAAGKIPLDVRDLGLDLVSLSAHKMYGPKGIGALYVRSARPRVRLECMIDGGGHERGLRSGTLNVPAIAGFGEAARIAGAGMTRETERLAGLRDRLKDAFLKELDLVRVNGPLKNRLAHNLNISFAHVESESLLKAIPDIAVSSGAACASAELELSHVLQAMGLREEIVHGSLRFGLGRFNTPEEVDYAAKKIIQEVKRLRAMSPLYRLAKEGTVAGSVEWTDDSTNLPQGGKAS